MKRKITIAVMLVFIAIIAFAQKSVFKWQYGMYENTSVFDSTKYTREQIQNTLDYLLPNGTHITTNATAWNLDGINNLSINVLKKECEEKIAIFSAKKFIETPFWLKLKQDIITEINSLCELETITIQAYTNPEILKSYKTTDNSCIYYRDALIAGGQEMINAWIKLNEKLKSQNGFPDNVQKEFDKKFNSTQKMEYARLDLMQSGWWNSANSTIPYVKENNELIEKEFEKLFLSTKTITESEE